MDCSEYAIPRSDRPQQQVCRGVFLPLRESFKYLILFAVPTYLSPIETHCSNIDYFPQVEDDKISNEDATSRLHLARSCIALFIISFVTIFCAFWTGLSGCWKRSSGAITATSILLLVTCLLAAGAMGLWHTVEFFEKEKVVGEDYYQQWNTVSNSLSLSLSLFSSACI